MKEVSTQPQSSQPQAWQLSQPQSSQPQVPQQAQPQPQPAQYLQNPQDFDGAEREGKEEHASGGMHWGWMVLCCIPMILIILLTILGIWGLR